MLRHAKEQMIMARETDHYNRHTPLRKQIKRLSFENLVLKNLKLNEYEANKPFVVSTNFASLRALREAV